MTRYCASIILLCTGIAGANIIEDVAKAAREAHREATKASQTLWLPLYHAIGTAINEYTELAELRAHLTTRLHQSLTRALPGSKAFSKKSLQHMARFAQEYSIAEASSCGLELISWEQAILLLSRSSKEMRARLARQSAENNWSLIDLWEHMLLPENSEPKN